MGICRRSDINGWNAYSVYQNMSFIVMVGCDGSGKSSVINELIESLESDGVPVTTGHWCPKPFSKKGSRSVDQSTVENPHDQIPRSAVGSIFKLIWIGVNWWLAWWLSLVRDARMGHVIFDRYYGDLLVDPRRYRYGGPMCLARLWVRLLPQPDILIFLDAPEEILLKRKQEVPFEALTQSRARYHKLIESNKNGVVVDASLVLEKVVGTIVGLVAEIYN